MHEFDVACVEDFDGDAWLIRRALTDSPHMSLRNFLRATDLDSLRRLVLDHPFDVVLLDLGLPDSFGLETIETARSIVGSTPLVVLTGDERLGVESIAAGADDFVAKADIDNGHLARVLAHSVERHRLVIRVAQIESEHELDRIGALVIPRREPRASRDGRSGRAGFLQHCRETFGEVVLHRVRGAQDRQGATLEALSEQLAADIIGPNEVVALLTGAVEDHAVDIAESDFAAFVREGRLALIEVMGHLIGAYSGELAGRGDAHDDDGVDATVVELDDKSISIIESRD